MKKILAKIIMPVTKRIRAYQAKQFVEDVAQKNLLDIGCGDKYFIKTFKDIRAKGTDKKIHGPAEEILPNLAEKYDYITMLAVIEHFDDPLQILDMCHKSLTKEGLVIMTTPFHKTESLINMYLPDHGHTMYFTKKDFENMEKYRLIHYSTFEFGLNQLIVLKKKVV